jgi:hypothetical protein
MYENREEVILIECAVLCKNPQGSLRKTAPIDDDIKNVKRRNKCF